MDQELTSTLTERGQVSFPSQLRKKAHLHPGQKLRWTQISPTEFRVTVIEEEKQAAGPLAVLGYARRKYHPDDARTTDEIMAELREGESDDDS